MSRINPATRPQPLSHTPKQVSVDLDEMDPINWNFEPSPADLALLNVVELECDEISRLVECESPSEESRKRSRDEDLKETKVPQDGIFAAVSLDSQEQEEKKLLVALDEPARSSRKRRKRQKSCRGNSFPKRPLGAYGIFYHQERQKIVESLTEGSLSEDDIQRQVGKLWRALPADDTKKFEQLAEKEKVRYHEEMEVHGRASKEESCLKSPPKNHQGKMEGEGEYFAHDYPPPPPGVTVIPAYSGASDAESVAAAAAGMMVATPSSSPVPPTSSRWGYGRSTHPVHYSASYPSPVPSAGHCAPHVVQSSPRPNPARQYYPTHSPYHNAPHHHRPPIAPRYCPDFSHAARPVPFYPTPAPVRPHYYSVPPGMELALPDQHGREKKYRVTYKCYRMKAEEVQGFLDSMAIHEGHPPQRYAPYHPHPHQHQHQYQQPRQPPPLPPRQPSYGPPRW